jgi:hypothetical protein
VVLKKVFFVKMSSSTKPVSVEIDNHENQFYNAQDLKKFDSEFFHGTSRSVRGIIESKNIPTDSYLYATYNKKKGWNIYDNSPPTCAKLFISDKWVHEHMSSMATEPVEPVEEVKEQPVKKKVSIKNAPDILELDDNEKWTNDEGVAYDIETRGKREHNKIYFLGGDVAKAFEMPSLIKTLTNKEYGYIRNVHYKTFLRSLSMNHELAPKKRIFITYKGMLKILFSSKSGTADNFVDWASRVLFTHQMGTEEQKEDLAADMMGVSAKALREVLNKSAESVPCVYLFSLGTAKTLRKTMKLSSDIPDDYTIVKYGLTNDLSRRTAEHIKTYEKGIKGVKLELIQYIYIDAKYLSEAENMVKEFFANYESPINYKSFSELVAINPKHFKRVRSEYKNINIKYAGCVKRLIDEQKDNVAKHALEIQAKEIEILKLKLELADAKK